MKNIYYAVLFKGEVHCTYPNTEEGKRKAIEHAEVLGAHGTAYAVHVEQVDEVHYPQGGKS